MCNLKLLTKVPIEKFDKPHQSKPFNPLISSVFYKAGFIENWGKGTLNIIAECLEYGLPKPTYAYEWTAIRTTFYKAKIDVGVNEVFEFIKQHQPTKVNIIAQSFNVTQRTIERYIKQLKDSEKIEFRGSSKTGGYHVK